MPAEAPDGGADGGHPPAADAAWVASTPTLPDPGASMRTAFYLDVTMVVAALLLACLGLSHLPGFGPLLKVADGPFAFEASWLALVAAALLAAWWFGRRAFGRPLPLPSIPGVSARTSGIASLLLAIPASLTLFWWISAGRPRLPVGPVGWTLGIVALAALAWVAIAAGALWLGRGTEKEREAAELADNSPIGI